MLDDQTATLIESVHRGHLFAYTASDWLDGAYRLSIVRDGETGHYPISEDAFTGTRSEAYAEAERLNTVRLRLPIRHVMAIVAGSMSGSPR